MVVPVRVQSGREVIDGDSDSDVSDVKDECTD